MQSQQEILSIRNYNRIYNPTRYDIKLVAAQTKESQKLTALSFLRIIISFETKRIHVYDAIIIDTLTDQLWDSSTPFQQEKWTAFANDVNEIKRANEELLNRISGITEPQIVNSDFERNFFYGVSFP
ncbi:6727_t:CDS:1 [Funneliformis caledonium]|uniref:6727_t:CDS:1 n=1 Tax=Funneliformis caledonium TaxID=1117310 RepID=A0A9N9GPS4_9GLOM|nr:6727_t:CDS:1 [Funneliformis caledonium]